MRRSLSSALVVVLWAASVMPSALGALVPPVPACCRRGGVHHCAAMVNLDPVGTPRFLPAHNCPFRAKVSLISSHLADFPNISPGSAPLPFLALHLNPAHSAELPQFSPYAHHGRAPPLRPTQA